LIGWFVSSSKAKGPEPRDAHCGGASTPVRGEAVGGPINQPINLETDELINLFK